MTDKSKQLEQLIQAGFVLAVGDFVIKHSSWILSRLRIAEELVCYDPLCTCSKVHKLPRTALTGDGKEVDI